MTKKLVVRGWTIAILVHAVVTGRVYSAQLMKSKPVTLIQKYDSYGPSGEYGGTWRTTTAIRSDGSRVDARSLTTPGGVSFHNRVIYDLARGRKITTVSVSKSKMTARLDPSLIESMKKETANCALDRSSERTHYQGYEVVKQITPQTTHNGAGKTRESWLAPELNCLELRRISTLTQDGKSAVVVKIETESVSVGEPNPHLFEVSDEYVERAPSAITREVERSLGIPPRPSRPFDSRLDEGYRRNAP